jgi:hypothetical protein
VVILLPVGEIPEFLATAMPEGILPRIDDAAGFAVKHRVLLMKHAPSGVNIDISLGLLPFEEELVARAGEQQVGDLRIRLPTPEDLIILKAVAGRPKDLEDIRSILEKSRGLDRSRITRWVKAFAETLEAPELWESVRPMIEE